MTGTNRLGTESSQTPCRKGMDSNLRFPDAPVRPIGLWAGLRRWPSEPRRLGQRQWVITFGSRVTSTPTDQSRAMPEMRLHSASNFLLSPEVGRDRVRRTRALMIEIPACRSRQVVLARGQPRLGYAPLMKIVRR
jgi:hypothetical protein